MRQKEKAKLELERFVMINDLLTAQGLSDRALRVMIQDARAVQNMFADVFAYLDTTDDEEDRKQIEHIEDLAIDNLKRIERLQKYQADLRKMYKTILNELDMAKYYEP